MNWKAVAIVFIILFVIETILFVLIFELGYKMIESKNTCSSTCQVKDADSFLYDDATNICECYRNNEVFYKAVIK